VSTGIDYADLIARVLQDRIATLHMRELWHAYARNVFDDRERDEGKLRVSDSGSCKLSLWAELHDKLTIPENYASMDDKMQPGILDGARTACLIAAGIRRWCWPFTTEIEPELDYGYGPPYPIVKIAGHADLVVYAEPDPIEVVECKMTLYTKGIEPPENRHRYWIHQACAYALGLHAPSFVVLVHAPAVWNGPTRVAYRYNTADYAEETAREYERLTLATLDDPPEADADEDWRCKSCRYAHCERNMNPRLPSIETIVDEVGVI
jgi:PD-(D/E)XK nuclease superfamily protein